MIHPQEAYSHVSQKDLERSNNQMDIITHAYEEIFLYYKQPVQTDETVMTLTNSTGGRH